MGQETTISLAEASKRLAENIFAELSGLPCVKQAAEQELCGQTGSAQVTLFVGDDALHNPRYATIKVTMHKPTFGADAFDEARDEWALKVAQRAAKSKSKAEAEE